MFHKNPQNSNIFIEIQIINMADLLNTLNNGFYPNYLIKTNILVLLENGANPNKTYPDGTSALSKAIHILQQINSCPNKNKYILGDRMTVIVALMQYGAKITRDNEKALVELLGEEYAVALIEFAYHGDKTNMSFVFHIARLIYRQ